MSVICQVTMAKALQQAEEKKRAKLETSEAREVMTAICMACDKPYKHN